MKRNYKKEYERRKNKIPTHFEGVVNQVLSLLQKNLKNENDKKLLIKSLKRLQEYYGLSIEYIRYLILSQFSRNANKLIYIQYGKKKTEKEIKRLKRILQEQGIKITNTRTMYKDWDKTGWVRVNKQRTIRFFRL